MVSLRVLGFPTAVTHYADDYSDQKEQGSPGTAGDQGDVRDRHGAAVFSLTSLTSITPFRATFQICKRREKINQCCLEPETDTQGF